MKFCIVKDQPWTMCLETFTFIDTRISAVNDTATGTKSKYQKFKAAFKQSCASNSNQKWPLAVELRQMDSNLASETSLRSEMGRLDIILRGNVLKKLHQLLYHGNDNVTLEIMLHLTNQDILKTLRIEGLNALKDSQGLVDLTCYEVKNVEAPLPPKSSPSRGNWIFPTSLWRLAVEITGSDFMSAEDVLPVGSGINSRIFMDRNFCDFELVSAEGTAVKCHKTFLCAHSSVFSNLLLGRKFKETQENKMEMPGMSTRSVNAFLAFIYCDEIKEALTCCDVALELLKASDMYDIVKLWNAMETILREKSARWYSVEGALNLFAFIRNCERPHPQGRENLLQKVIKILMIKRDKLPQSTLYAEMFPTAVSREMFERSLDLADSLKKKVRQPDTNPVGNNAGVSGRRYDPHGFNFSPRSPPYSPPRAYLPTSPVYRLEPLVIHDDDV